MNLNPRLEIITMLEVLKQSASVMPYCISSENNYPEKTITLEDIDMESFEFVINCAIEYIKDF